MKKQLFLTLFMILSLTGCSRSGFFSKATPTPQVLADCFLTFDLFAWVDSNSNGEFDADELTLENVQFTVEGNYAYSAAHGHAFSDTSGKAVVDTWTPGSCPENFTIKAAPPDGYQLVTDGEITYYFDTPVTGYPLMSFGFEPIN